MHCYMGSHPGRSCVKTDCLSLMTTASRGHFADRSSRRRRGSTTSATGSYIIPDETFTLRINNQVSSITLPDAATHKGRILYLINWPGNSQKPFVFLNGNDLFDVTTNSTVTAINGGQKMMIQSAGNRWLLLDK